MTISENDYINKVLHALPSATPQRDQIALELRGHIAERLAHGHSLADVFAQLGDPAALARSYLTAEPLAAVSFGRRAAAKLVDIFTVLAVWIPVLWVAATLGSGDLMPVFLMFGILVGSAFLFGLYTVVAEAAYGQTVGKRLLGLRVAGEDGSRISFGQAVVRQLPLFLQVYWIDVFFALFTTHNQRAFELLSKTRVVRAFTQEVR
jgi:uncharacterized RDD family membrane protein YckC